MVVVFFFFFKQKTAYEMRISDWSSDVCSSDLSSARTFRRCGDDPRRDSRWGRSAGRLRVSARRSAGQPRPGIAPHGTGQAHPRAIAARQARKLEIGSAPGRERVCQDVWISEDAVSLKKKTNQTYTIHRR